MNWYKLIILSLSYNHKALSVVDKKISRHVFNTYSWLLCLLYCWWAGGSQLLAESIVTIWWIGWPNSCSPRSAFTVWFLWVTLSHQTHCADLFFLNSRMRGLKCLPMNGWDDCITLWCKYASSVLFFFHNLLCCQTMKIYAKEQLRIS